MPRGKTRSDFSQKRLFYHNDSEAVASRVSRSRNGFFELRLQECYDENFSERSGF
jgi:hypothetical protein